MGRSVRTIFKFGLLLCLAAVINVSVPAQKDKQKTPKPKPPIEAPEPPEPSEKPFPVPTPSRYPRGERVTSEKAIAVDPNVSIKLCVSAGRLKINGWERNEVRVFVKSGSPVGFKVLEKNAESGKPNWLWVSNIASGPRYGPQAECLSGDQVEIDVPMTAGINLTGTTAGATIDSVRKVSVKIIEGSINLRNIPGGITAEAYQGDVMLESSRGQIALKTTTGNIVAFDVEPGQIGDILKTQTNSGTISLQKVSHRQIEANSISGSVNFNGKFLAGGIYTFKTSNGSVRLLLPVDTSCKISAFYGFGTFDSSFPYKVLTEITSPGGKRLVVDIGGGDATVNLTTSSGSIGIRKQN
jgi:hypothetical protein